MMRAAMKIYVAGPYSQGDVAGHVRAAVLAGLAIRHAGHVPCIPHLYHFAHLLCPQPYEYWMALDLEWLAACDGLVRLPGESPGADREVERAQVLGLPVWQGLESFLLAHGPKRAPIEHTILELLEG